jgi:xanthine dehydrogenase accessory factor
LDPAASVLVAARLRQVIDERRLADLATVVSTEGSTAVRVGTKMLIDVDGAVWGSLGAPDLDRAVAEHAQQALSERKSRVLSYPVPGSGQVEVFHDVLVPQPQMLIVGAGHIAVPLARFAKIVGFEVVVLDDRDKYANQERFPEADRVIAADFGATLKDFPITVATYVVIITRAHTYDEESLRIILDKPWAYLGVIGSRRRVQTVMRTLAAEGYDRDRLAEIRAPIGLDIGSETPEEIALSIIGEVVAARRGGTGQPLSQVLRPVAV